MLHWTELKETAQLEGILDESKKEPILIFKHSTRCAISRTALDRLERSLKKDVKVYYLDLLSYRNMSNQIAEYFEVEHESPQTLLVKDGKAIHVRSHLAINADEISEVISTN